jgi:hypothetical protein
MDQGGPSLSLRLRLGSCGLKHLSESAPEFGARLAGKSAELKKRVVRCCLTTLGCVLNYS